MIFSLPIEILIYLSGFLEKSGINLFFVNKYFFSLIPLSKYQINITKYIFKNGYLDIIKYINYLKSINNEIVLDQNKFKKMTIKKAFKKSCKHGHLKVVQYLVNLGVNIRINKDYGIRWASRNNHPKIVKYLFKKNSDIKAKHHYALRKAAANGHLKVVQFLVNKGANIKIRNDEALKQASLNGHLTIVKFLIMIGANVNATNFILHKISENGYHDIVKFLIDHGAIDEINNNYYILPIKPAIFKFGTMSLDNQQNDGRTHLRLSLNPQNGDYLNLIKFLKKADQYFSSEKFTKKLFEQKKNKYLYGPVIKN